jgi:glutamate/tyrosine decarboxylase-like PLP-dependent enzyme
VARVDSDRWCRLSAEDPQRLASEVLFESRIGTVALDLHDALIGLQGKAEYSEDVASRAVSIGIRFLHRADRAEPVLNYAPPEEVQALLNEDLPTSGEDLAGLLGRVEADVVRLSIQQSHSGYLAFPDAANSAAAVAGALLGRLLNQNLIAFDRSAPAATFVEIQLIQWLRQLLGYSWMPLDRMSGVRQVGGLWMPGGHLSNHTAMLTALGRHAPEVRNRGLAGLPERPTVVMASPIAHYSHSDAAFHLGLGWDSIRRVGARLDFTTDLAAVDQALSNPPAGERPFMVVGVAGNCRTTGLDDLSGLADICARHSVWLHVDACHGGSLLFSKRLKDRHLAGIERADSVALDPHKGLFTPYPSSYLLVRDPQTLTQFSRHTDLVQQDGCWDLGLITPFLGSRGFESLSTWTMIKHLGVEGLGRLVEARQAHVRHLERRIASSSMFTVLNDVDFYRVAFVLCPPQARAEISRRDAAGRARGAALISDYTSKLNTLLYQEGRFCFDEHTLADLGDRLGVGCATVTVIAACPGSPAITLAQIDSAIDRLLEAAVPLAAELTAALRDDSPHAAAARHGGPAGWADE